MTPFFPSGELVTQLRHLGIHLDKKRGQCFLIDKNIAEFIVNALDICKEDSVLEIGPGLGTLTDFISKKTGKLTLIEQDKKFNDFQKEHFKDNPNVVIINGDALKVEWPFFNKIISNVPYHISGPLFAKIATCKFEKGVFMVQKEFANRLVALPNSPDYGRLSVVYSLIFEISILKQVSNAVFLPKPEVQSTIISIKPKISENKIQKEILDNLDSLMWLLQLIFPYKNKILRRAIKDGMNTLKD
ncbi:TPA: ribosomal RNA small subunit methyltransferase A, partial [bacterium]|nr:ribosomal RNA small subunit methyltransferase A [bacterium]